jgi:hypothetical protein
MMSRVIKTAARANHNFILSIFAPETVKNSCMENNTINHGSEIQVELTEETAQGTYANLAIIAHSSSEFILDFIRIVPGMTKAKVQSRVILTPDNAKRLLFALDENIRKFEDQHGKGGGYNDFIPPVGGIKGEA